MVPALLTTHQVQELLHVDRSTVYRLVERGELPALRVGKQWRFRSADLDPWLSAVPTVPAGAAPGATAAAQDLPLDCLALLQEAFALLVGAVAVVDQQGYAVLGVSGACRVCGNGGLPAGDLRVAAGHSAANVAGGRLGLMWAMCPWDTGRSRGAVLVGGRAPAEWAPEPAALADAAQTARMPAGALYEHIHAEHPWDAVAGAQAQQAARGLARVLVRMAHERTQLRGRLAAIASLAVDDTVGSEGG